ncbi:MAG: hypothetical protein Hens3KO_20020 [Henriciella sp.]
MGKLVSSALALAVAAGAFAAPAVAEGEFSGNVALTTDYVWRGFSQNSENPAIQGGFDYADGAFYVGTWASIVDFGGANMELDLYGGFAGETESGLGWDVGVIGYIYPDTDDLDFLEVYGGLSYEFEGGVGVGGTIYFDPDNETVYLDTGIGFGVTDALSVDGTVGAYLDGFDEYQNYSLGATFATEFVDFDLRVWATDVDDDDLAEERIVLTLSRAL